MFAALVNTTKTTVNLSEYKGKDQIMSEIYNSALDAKVAARNQVNLLANACFPEAIRALEPFLGQKVCKVDGSLLEKVKRALPDLKDGWYSASRYSLVLNLKVHACAKGKTSDYQSAHYADATVYLADLTSGILTRLYDTPDYKTDYSADFVRQAREEVRQAEALKSKAESKIHHFGMYDN